MALPLWGLQEKSQDDSSTIDEAIAAAILVHEADPDSHLGEGESLEAHKTETMIDHPAGSVASDKLPQEHFLLTAFESIDGWATFNSGSAQIVQDFGSVRLMTGTTSGSWSYLYAVPSVWIPFDLAKTAFWKVTVRFTDNDAQLAYLSWGGPATGDFISGLGFKVVDGLLYAFENDGEIETLSSAISVTLTDWNVYEIRYNASTGVSEWFINGVSVHSSTLAFSSTQSDEIAVFIVRNTETVQKQLQITDLVFQIAR